MLSPAKFWPKEKPDVPRDPHGWFAPCVAERVRAAISKDMTVLLELGAWMGMSTRFICDHAPEGAQIITVDTWKGSVEHQGDVRLETLYETFLVNCWDYKDRLAPLRMTTQEGMKFIRMQGIEPQFVFIDADHSYEGVCADIQTALDFWPNIKIVGDDWAYGGAEDPAYPVRKAAIEMAGKYDKHLMHHSNAWWYA